MLLTLGGSRSFKGTMKDTMKDIMLDLIEETGYYEQL